MPLLDLFKSDAFMEVEDPREYRYMKILRFTLRLLGAWPGKELKEEAKYEIVPAYFLIFIKVCSIFSNILYVKRHTAELSFLEVGHNYIIVFMSVVTLSRLTSLPIRQKYRNLMKRFVTELHLAHFKNESDFALETHVKVHKTSYFFSIYLNILLATGVVLFNSHTMYINYKNGKFDTKNPNNITFEMPIYFELPFDTTTDLNGYIVVAIFNWYSTYICTSVFCMFDLILFVMVFHLRGHFQILIHNLNSFPIPATCSREVNKNTRLYSDTEMAAVSKMLKECIDYHRLLAGFALQISEAFGPMLFVCYMFHQVSGCLLLLEISQMSSEALIRYGPLTLALFQQLIQLSFVIESIDTVTGNLKDAVYSVPWEYMDTSNRKTVMIFLMNVQEPLHVKALGLTNVGVTSAASILKTSLSYFAFLRTIAD